jgi:uncharacterized protein YbaR (Trm112 family)
MSVSVPALSAPVNGSNEILATFGLNNISCEFCLKNHLGMYGETRMKYCDLRPALEAYRKGENVMATLRELLGEEKNNEQICEIAYDLQAGTYSRYAGENPAPWNAYCEELADILSARLEPGWSTLDVGTGEMTTLAGVANRAFTEASDTYSCDISFSRIKAGRQFVARNMEPTLAERLQSFVGNLFHLPFQDASVNLIWTSHALEPNGGKEEIALRELFRVAARYTVLFEPSYENNTDEGRARMERLGYIRGLPEAIARTGAELVDVIQVKSTANPFNPTYAYVCRTGVETHSRATPWACPETHMPMERLADCFFSKASRLAYPIIDSIPILRAENAILANALDGLDWG